MIDHIQRMKCSIIKPYEEEGKPFLFVLNQVDKIEAFRAWDEKRMSQEISNIGIYQERENQ